MLVHPVKISKCQFLTYVSLKKVNIFFKSRRTFFEISWGGERGEIKFHLRVFEIED